MNCWLCGHEGKSHHLGCVRAAVPALTIDQAVEAGLMAMPEGAEPPPIPVVEILKPNSMQTIPEPRAGEQCEFNECENPKYSDSPRAKYCEEHKDPKNRKE